MILDQAVRMVQSKPVVFLFTDLYFYWFFCLTLVCFVSDCILFFVQFSILPSFRNEVCHTVI